MENFYHVLEIDPAACDSDVEKALNQKQRVAIRNTNSAQMDRRQEAERTVRLLDEARKVLLNPAERALYDRALARNGATASSTNGNSLPSRQGNPTRASSHEVAGLVSAGWDLLSAGKVAEALAAAARAVELSPDYAQAWALQGQASHTFGNSDNAIHSLNRAIRLQPTNAAFYHALGAVYQAMGNWDAAHLEYQRAAQLDPQTTAYRFAIGCFHAHTRNLDEAISIFEQCVAEKPDNEGHGYQQALVMCYSRKAVEGWWAHDEKLYCLSESQASKAREFLRKANRLPIDDEELKTELIGYNQLVDSLFKRQFKGSWIIVIILGFFYVFPGVLWWWVNRRQLYKIHRDIYDVVQNNKSDGIIGGELGACYSALPPGFKWIASVAPRLVTYPVILLLSPFTFFYLVYDNYSAKLFGWVAGGSVSFFLLVVLLGQISSARSSHRTSEPQPLSDVAQGSVLAPATPSVAPASNFVIPKTQQTSMSAPPSFAVLSSSATLDPLSPAVTAPKAAETPGSLPVPESQSRPQDVSVRLAPQPNASLDPASPNFYRVTDITTQWSASVSQVFPVEIHQIVFPKIDIQVKRDGNEADVILVHPGDEVTFGSPTSIQVRTLSGTAKLIEYRDIQPEFIPDSVDAPAQTATAAADDTPINEAPAEIQSNVSTNSPVPTDSPAVAVSPEPVPAAPPEAIAPALSQPPQGAKAADQPPVQTTLENSLNDFLKTYWQANLSNDVEQYSVQFASQVNYCYKDVGIAPRDFIKEDREKLIQAWPVREMTQTSLSTKLDGQTALVNLGYDWHYAGARGSRSGSCVLKLGLAWNGAQWEITFYDEKVKRR